MDALEFRVVSVDEARETLEVERRQTAAVVHGPVEARPESDVLLDVTVRWMAGLPEGTRPIELARAYPRIANALAELWRRVARCEEYLDSLVVDDRGGRKGFPVDVAMELTRLRSYYAELHPGGSTWDLIERTR